MVYHSMNEDDVRYFMKYPFNMIGADGGVVVYGKGMPIQELMALMQECWQNM
jgi:N-acyl-D-amino-acid deacylase